MRRVLCLIPACVAAIIVLATANEGAAQARQLPDVSLEVATRQKDQGVLSTSIHTFNLVCGAGNCTLATLSLNQCGPSSGGDAFFPKVEMGSTAQGTLTVVNLGNVLEVHWRDTTSMFGFTPAPQGSIATRVTSFSAATTYYSRILGKMVAFEFVPFTGTLQVVRFACPSVLLLGIPN